MRGARRLSRPGLVARGIGVALACALLAASPAGAGEPGAQAAVRSLPPLPPAPVLPAQGAFITGNYRNLFAERGYGAALITAKVQAAWDTLFYGTPTERLYFTSDAPVAEACILDPSNNTIKTSGLQVP